MLLTWGLLGTLALIYYLQKHYDIRTVDDYERLFEQAYFYALWGGSGLALLIVPLVLIRRRANKRAQLDTSFRSQPAAYDKKIIMLTGRVERVFNVSFGEKMRRRTTKLVRKITGNTDRTGANIQQRFLISSPQLKWGEPIFIIHNVSFGKLTLRRGIWFEVQGEYLHQTSPRRNPWRRLFLGSMTHYGKLHCTHEPKGYIERVARPSKKALAAIPVAIVDEKHGRKPNGNEDDWRTGSQKQGGRSRIDLRKESDGAESERALLGLNDEPAPFQLKYGSTTATSKRGKIELRKDDGESGRVGSPPDSPQRNGREMRGGVASGARDRDSRRERGFAQPAFDPGHTGSLPRANGSAVPGVANSNAPSHGATTRSRATPSDPRHGVSQNMVHDTETTRSRGYNGLPQRTSSQEGLQHSPHPAHQRSNGGAVGQMPMQGGEAPTEMHSEHEAQVKLDSCSGLPPLRIAIPSSQEALPEPASSPSDERSKIIRVPSQRGRQRR